VKDVSIENVRNFTLAGHAGAGKTSLADLMVFKSGAVSRAGSVDEGTSVSDFRAEEQERRSSIFTAALHCSWNDHHFFFTDTPGYADFCGEAISAISVADMVVIVVDAGAGIGPGTVRAWKQAAADNTPRAFFITGLDREQADFDRTLDALRNSYGVTTCVPFTLPVGQKADLSGVVHVLLAEDPPAELADAVEQYREALRDTAVEADEELMERFMEGEEDFSEAEIAKGLHQAIVEGSVVPVFCGSAAKDIGVEELMNGIANLCPNPVAGRPVPLQDGELARAADDPEGLAFVFKSVTDPFIGQLTFLRVFSGKFRSDSEVFNVTQGGRERVGSLLFINGKEQETAAEATPGDIVAVAKLKSTQICDTLALKSTKKQLPPIQFPQPTMSQAVSPAKKGDEEKISSGLQRLEAEDPTLKLERNPETRQAVLYGMGDQHIATVIGRLRNEFKVEVNLATPKVPYRETITGTGSAQYRHKKQTGGHGQFAEVHLRLETLPDEHFEFASEVVGGNIPKNFIPAVEKGVVEALAEGPLAGCRVTHVRAIVYDGKHHEVDSSEIAFKIAARNAFQAAMKQAKPILLEPIMRLRIMFPEEYMGDITGDLNSRRGRILGMDREEGLQIVHAEAPMAETFTYATQIRSITQGRGTFEMAFERYEQVPANVSQQIQAAAAQAKEEE